MISAPCFTFAVMAGLDPAIQNNRAHESPRGARARQLDGRIKCGHDNFIDGAGFSLMELIVVLAVMALSVALIAPAIGTRMPGLQLRAEAREIAHVLDGAQARALRTHQPVSVTIDLNSSKILRGGTPVLAIDRKIGIAVTSALGAQSDEGAPRFVFFPDGTTTGGRIALSRKGVKLFIEANWLTGHVRTFKPKV